MPGIFGNWFSDSPDNAQDGRIDYIRLRQMEHERARLEQRNRELNAEMELRAREIERLLERERYRTAYREEMDTIGLSSLDNAGQSGQSEPAALYAPTPNSEDAWRFSYQPRPTGPTSAWLSSDWREDFLTQMRIPGATIRMSSSAPPEYRFNTVRSSRSERSTYKKPKKIGKRDRLY